MRQFILNNSFLHFEGQTTDYAARLITILNARLLTSGLSGTFFESGTFKGKSAAIFLGLPNTSAGVLVDASDYLEQDKLRSHIEKPFCFVQSKSEDAFSSQVVSERLRESKVIWAHLDASHYFSNVSFELQCISDFMNAEGVICLDDWNDTYSQVRAAYYFLFYARSFDWELFLTGFNKAFLCRKETFGQWSDYIISTFSQDILVDDRPFLVQLQRTDISDHSRNFALRRREASEPTLYGLNIWGDRFYRKSSNVR